MHFVVIRKIKYHHQVGSEFNCFAIELNIAFE